MQSVQTVVDPAAIAKQQRWDWRYLDLASVISKWSKDKAQVGAVIVDSTLGRIIAVGFNGFPTNITDCAVLLKNKAKKREQILHAEQNALLFAGRDARHCHLYVVGKPICNTCAILAIQSGIDRVIALPPMAQAKPDNKWEKAGRLACTLLDQAGVIFVSHAKVGWRTPDFASHNPDLMLQTPVIRSSLSRCARRGSESQSSVSFLLSD